MTHQELQPNEHLPQYTPYIHQVPSDRSLVDALIKGKEETYSFFQGLPAEKGVHAYAPGKWTPKQIFLHLIDAERIFAYRALRIARNDITPTMGFEQDDYIGPSKANTRSIQSLLEEYELVRQANISLFQSMDDEMLQRVGNASGGALSTRAAGFIIAGHERSHIKIIKERYL